MTKFKEFAPAKINLTLRVLGRRPDGYHELESLVAFADVGDWVTLDVSKPVGVTTSGPFAGSIAGANLVEVALRRLVIEAPQLRLGSVHLEKNLPVAAGIGGGSADAAAVIRAVKRANAEQVETLDWNAFALRLGADVPVCLISRAAWMTGDRRKGWRVIGPAAASTRSWSTRSRRCRPIKPRAFSRARRFAACRASSSIKAARTICQCSRAFGLRERAGQRPRGAQRARVAPVVADMLRWR